MAMASYSSSSSTSGLFSWVAPALHALADRIERRSIYLQTLAELEQLSTRELDDLGLSRDAIRRVARDAAYGDATKHRV